MPAPLDLTGQRFGRLTAISFADMQGRRRRWLFKCDCGSDHTVRSDHVREGRVVSCGCANAERIVTHGATAGCSAGGKRDRLYGIWGGMKDRCYREGHAHFDRYGGRGITVCDAWRDDFTAFRDWALANGYEPHLTIDRRDNDLGYAPGNCRWATESEQALNRAPKRSKVVSR